MWIDAKQQLPDEDRLILIKLKYQKPNIFVAKFLRDLSSFDGNHHNIFMMISHPHFPKEWLFDERYKKISRIHKSKVDKWIYIDTNYSLDQYKNNENPS